MGKFLKSNRIFGIAAKALYQLVYFFNTLAVHASVRVVGTGLRVGGRVRISGGKNIFIGKNVYLGHNVAIYADNGKIQIGDNVKIRDGVRIYSRGILIGNGTTLAENVFVNGVISIGENTWVSRGSDISGAVVIETSILGPHSHCCGEPDHPRHQITRQILMETEGDGIAEKTLESYRVVIKKGSWLGTAAIILKGVTVGEGAIVGAGSIVTKNVEPYSTVAGSPARPIK